MTRSPLGLPHQLDGSALTCRAIVETPFGSTAKFVFDEKSGLFALGKLLPKGLSFPFDFGFIPSTCGGDGDALDVIILNECALPVGCEVDVRLLGLIEVEQWRDSDAKVRNDRLVARLSASRQFSQLGEIGELPAGMVDQWNGFFAHYKSARGEGVRVLGVRGARAAAEIIEGSAR